MDQRKKPNFLVIVADDLGFSDIGCFGSEIHTPNLDKLATQGVRMTGFHTAAACSPTRAMLFSGTDNHVAGMGIMAERRRRYSREIQDTPGYEGYMNFKVAALPEILQDNGYHTILSGKWHLGMLPELAPHSRGFDRSFTMLSGCHNHYCYEPQFGDTASDSSVMGSQNTEAAARDVFQNWAPAIDHKKGMYNKEGQPIDIPANVPYDPSGFFSSESFTNQLLEYLEESTTLGKPFFSCLMFTAPHWPLQAPKRLRDKYKGIYDDGPATLRLKRLAKLEEMGLLPRDTTPHPVIGTPKVLEWDEMSDEQRKKSVRAMETYAAMVEHMDETIGKLMKRMEEMGMNDDTVVIFMSDNGAEGASWEAVPHMGDKLMHIIDRYYDNSLENIGEPDSFVWYGPFWAQASTAPTRLYKGFSTQGGIRVPLIIRYPPFHTHVSSACGSILEHSTTVMDIAATVLDLAEIQHPVEAGAEKGIFRNREVVKMRGKSWKGMLERGEVCHDETEELGWELHGRAAMRIGSWKITFVPPPFGPGKWQLYNLQDDPGECFDLKDQEPEKFKELCVAWEKYIKLNGVVWGEPMPQKVLDASALEDVVDSATGWMKK